jgi:hypothetical protein
MAVAAFLYGYKNCVHQYYLDQALESSGNNFANKQTNKTHRNILDSLGFRV